MDALNDLVQSLVERGGVGHVNDGPAFGLSPEAVSAYWRRRRWPRPLPGVIALPGTDLRRHHARVRAGVEWVREPVAVTGASALHLHGVIDREPTLVTLVVPTTRRNRRRDGIVVHRSDLAITRPVETVAGAPTVSVAWALRDRARFGGPHRLRTLAIRTVQRRKATLGELFSAATTTSTSPGVPELLEVLEMIRRDRVDSGVELDLRHLVRGEGYEPWPRPFPWRCPDGRVIHLDVPFPDIWFAIECDDPSTHGTDRAFYVDRTRWTQAMRGGWKLTFVWRERLRDDPRGVIEEIDEAFRSTDRDRPPADPAHECGDRCPPEPRSVVASAR